MFHPISSHLYHYCDKVALVRAFSGALLQYGWCRRLLSVAASMGAHVCSSGINIVTFQRGLEWWWLRRSFLGVMYHLLFVKSVSHGHFFLKAKKEQSTV